MSKPQQIIELMEPFIKEGRLLPRSLETINNCVDDFVVIENENKIIASPLTTIIKNKYSDFVKEIIKIVEENQIKGIVIGNPINMDGTASHSSQSAKDLAINLSKDVTKNVTLWDERLSSQGAFSLAGDLAINTSKKVDKLDENSAQFILQGALDYLTK